MKKQLLVAVVSGALMMGSCKEKGPAIDFSNVKSADSTWLLSSPEPVQPRNVLVEEVTGVKCPNCPAGAKSLKDIDEANQDRLVIIALHAGNLTSPIDDPAHPSKYDLRNNSVLGVYQFFGSEPSKPAAVIDRTAEGANYFLDNRTKWPNVLDARLATSSPIRLSMTSSYNPETREDTITIRVSYTSAVSKPQSIIIAVAENHIIDPQYNGTAVIDDYEHEHVFRDFVTPLNGSDFLNDYPTKEAGRVYQRTYIYKVPDVAFGEEKTKWNLDNCKLVGFVFNNQSPDFEVAQAIEIDLK